MEISEIIKTLLENEEKSINIRMISLSNSIETRFTKVRIRPITVKNKKLFQIEEFTEKQAFQKNVSYIDLRFYLLENIANHFKNTEIQTINENISILISKKGKTTVLRKKNAISFKTDEIKTQNRQKKYLLPEGEPVNFLVKLGIMTKTGDITASKYDKYRQINRFLEYIDDILPEIIEIHEKEQGSSPLNIVDFGCGKSYLTFAVYYYLTEIKKLSVNIMGLDLKKDVIDFCNKLSEECSFKSLYFLVGNISDKEIAKRFTHCDLVMTLHACDTATDFALSQAISWNTSAILSVPCCQHEVNQQLKKNKVSKDFEPYLKYGIIQERFAALTTDLIRAEVLEENNYSVQLLEFIDMEGTPKNLLIRAIRTCSKKQQSYKNLCNALNINPSIVNLLGKNSIEN